MDNEIEDAAVNLLFAEEEEQLLDRIVEFLDNLNPNIVTLASSTFQTLEMVFFSTLIAFVIGFPIGIMLNSTSKYGITPRPVLNLVVSRIIDVLRSFPFVILMIVLLPFTRLVLKTESEQPPQSFRFPSPRHLSLRESRRARWRKSTRAWSWRRVRWVPRIPR